MQKIFTKHKNIFKIFAKYWKFIFIVIDLQVLDSCFGDLYFMFYKAVHDLLFQALCSDFY